MGLPDVPVSPRSNPGCDTLTVGVDDTTHSLWMTPTAGKTLTLGFVLQDGRRDHTLVLWPHFSRHIFITLIGYLATWEILQDHLGAASGTQRHLSHPSLLTPTQQGPGSLGPEVLDLCLWFAHPRLFYSQCSKMNGYYSLEKEHCFLLGDSEDHLTRKRSQSHLYST